jgi:3',5'-cyclic AMP phosphodiesterase CpdA
MLLAFKLRVLVSPETVPAVRCGDEETLPVVGGNFVVLGDLQPTPRLEPWRESNDPERALIVSHVARMRPDFVALLGGLVFRGSSRSAWMGFDAVWAPIAAERIPTFPVLGHHEYGISPASGLAHFFVRFPRLRGRRWYAANYGPVGLVFLDSNRHALTAFLWETQMRWLERTLARFDASPKVRGVVVLLHHPPFTNGTLTPDARHVQQDVVPLFAAAEKTLAMVSGHVHSDERFARGGKHYIVAGGGGGPRRRRPDAAYPRPSIRSFRFLQFTPSAEELEATVYGRASGGDDVAPVERFQLPWPGAGAERAASAMLAGSA